MKRAVGDVQKDMEMRMAVIMDESASDRDREVCEAGRMAVNFEWQGYILCK